MFVHDVSPYFTAHTAVSMEKEHLGGKEPGSAVNAEDKAALFEAVARRKISVIENLP